MKPDPRLALLVGMLAVSSAAILFRFTTAPPLVVATYRLGIAGLLMLVLAGRRLTELKGLDFKELSLLITSGFFLALHFSAWFYSLRYTTIAASTVIVTSSPVVILLCSWILLRERPALLGVVGTLTSFIGMLIIFSGHGPGRFFGTFSPSPACWRSWYTLWPAAC